MNDKYSLKIIQSGKTQQVKILREGAGIAGQAVVLKVADGARLQLVKAVTLVSPDKIELKRVGKDLHLALPGGDLSAPDLIVEDYFAVFKCSHVDWESSANTNVEMANEIGVVFRVA
jgi:hypothetical protein